ncbi:hypothetical protein HZS_2527 [Henneguya salminicola]|nr:hypothetical protein HZS_2527 [Henneguya salminicola]
MRVAQNKNQPLSKTQNIRLYQIFYQHYHRGKVSGLINHSPRIKSSKCAPKISDHKLKIESRGSKWHHSD